MLKPINFIAMIYKKNHVFCTIKIGKAEINSIAKSIKSIMLKEKNLFVLFNLNCTDSIQHIKFCIDLMPKKFTATDYLKKLTGIQQFSLIRKKAELDSTKNCCFIVFESTKKKAEKQSIEIGKKIKFKENNSLISNKKRLKKLAKKEGLNKKALKGFGEDFYSALNNYFIEKSALVN